MYAVERIVAAVSIIWAIAAMVLQTLAARGGGRRDYSAKAGNSLKGIIFNLTWAMLPGHKETISLHPIKFAIGVLMHIGVFLAIARVLLLLIFPRMPLPSPIAFGVILGIAALCGVYLLLRRIFSIELHAMSSPEDYLSILMTIGFLSAAILHGLNIMSTSVFLILAAILFFYMPLGKLKHGWFFFVARMDYGARLGYRGTYPAKSGVGE